MALLRVPSHTWKVLLEKISMDEHGNATPPEGVEPVDQLLREGSARYLDALYALNRFTREVIAAATEVWQESSPELANKIGAQAGPAVSYCNPDGVNSRDCDGNWAWVTCRSWLAAPLNANCHLGLWFERERNGSSVSCKVTFLIEAKSLLQVLENVFQGVEHFQTQPEDRECGFYRPVENMDQLTRASLVEQFKGMMDYVIGLPRWQDLPR